MKEDYSKIIIFVVCLVFLFSAAATKVGAVPTQEDQIRLYLKQGIEKAFNLDNKAAGIYKPLAREKKGLRKIPTTVRLTLLLR